MEFLKKIYNGRLHAGVLFGSGVLCGFLWKAQTIQDYMVVFPALITIAGISALMSYFSNRKDEKGLSSSSNAKCEEERDEILEMQPELEEKPHTEQTISNEIKVDRELPVFFIRLEGVDPMDRCSEIPEEEAGGSVPTARRRVKGEVVTPATNQCELKDSKLEHSAELGQTLDIDASEAKEIQEILFEEFKRLSEMGISKRGDVATNYSVYTDPAVIKVHGWFRERNEVGPTRDAAEEKAGGTHPTAGRSAIEEKDVGRSDPTARLREMGGVVTPTTNPGELNDSKLGHPAELGDPLRLDVCYRKEIEDRLIKEIKMLCELEITDSLCQASPFAPRSEKDEVITPARK